MRQPAAQVRVNGAVYRRAPGLVSLEGFAQQARGVQLEAGHGFLVNRLMMALTTIPMENTTNSTYKPRMTASNRLHWRALFIASALIAWRIHASKSKVPSGRAGPTAPICSPQRIASSPSIRQ